MSSASRISSAAFNRRETLSSSVHVLKKLTHSTTDPSQMSHVLPPTSVYYMSARELGQAIAAGTITSAAIVETFLGRISRWQAKLNPFVEVYADQARHAASCADKLVANGSALGPLHGVPFVAKDLFDVEGFPTGAGSKTLPQIKARSTATAVVHLQTVGMILLGKTQTVEFAFGGWGTNPVMGTPWNPWDLLQHRIPGGSSSGTAVAIAAGLAPCGLGTDTGGSVRIPAAMCGLVGLKPSPGVVSRAGVFPLSHTHDTVGPLARSVVDIAHLLTVLQGADSGDAATTGTPWIDALGDLECGIAGMRLARLQEEDLGELSAGVDAAYRQALHIYGEMGASIAAISLPRSLDEYMRRAGEIMSVESYARLAVLVDDDHSSIDPFIRQRIRRGRDFDARQYLDLLHYRREIQAEMASVFGGIDALIVPTCPMAAIPVSQVDENTTPLSRLGRFVNLLDLCAVAIPAGLENGLPVSIQIVAPRFQDALALRLARAFETATDRSLYHPATN
jgi:aspartyl-tRNA(Asn)/glutamyl-tRNA(Gln) amidotransferase subunit A